MPPAAHNCPDDFRLTAAQAEGELVRTHGPESSVQKAGVVPLRFFAAFELDAVASLSSAAARSGEHAAAKPTP